ncbi:MAG: adenylosuccinate lyase [Chlamydiales bacterium]|nr:adenylosuccinate lyase [Chlamydiales bacterium]
MTKHVYESPLKLRYASDEMLYLFSKHSKYTTWRRLWIALAKAEKHIGLNITKEQIDELENAIHSIDYEAVKTHEELTQHDVMAHLYAYGDICPLAKPILHLGATSAFITDNADLLLIKQAFSLLETKLKALCKSLAAFSKQYKATICLSYTHLQPATPTTVGKRAALWLQDFLFDMQDLAYRQSTLSFLGLKGATGTQSSFLSLVKGDSQKVQELENFIAKELGFSKVLPLSGQTYTRKQDVHILNVLSGIAITAHKCANDLRLLAHLKEIEEPFESAQVGSSAMPHKRNPILMERICSLSRFVIALSENPSYTAATQWLERSLDDSANRRLVLPEAFLTADAILNLMLHCFNNLSVYPKIIEAHIKEELPFLLTEEILMVATKKGGDRQLLHEALRRHCQTVSYQIKVEGKSNNLLELISNDPIFNLSKDELDKLSDIKKLSGRAEEQVDEFLKNHIE